MKPGGAGQALAVTAGLVLAAAAGWGVAALRARHEADLLGAPVDDPGARPAARTDGGVAELPPVVAAHHLAPPPIAIGSDPAALDRAHVAPEVRAALDAALATAVDDVNRRLALDEHVDRVVAAVAAGRARAAPLLRGVPADRARPLLAPYDELERLARLRARTR